MSTKMQLCDSEVFTGSHYSNASEQKKLGLSSQILLQNMIVGMCLCSFEIISEAPNLKM